MQKYYINPFDAETHFIALVQLTHMAQQWFYIGQRIVPLKPICHEFWNVLVESELIFARKSVGQHL